MELKKKKQKLAKLLESLELPLPQGLPQYAGYRLSLID